MFMRFYIILISMFLITVSASAQSVFQFTTTNSSVNEADGMILAGYVKASVASPQNHNFILAIKSGSGVAADINNFSSSPITIPAMTDSLPVYITVTDDSIVEHLESIVFVLHASSAVDSLGSDSTFTVTITDNESPATFSFLIPTDTIWETQTVYNVTVVCNNPNPTGVRCFVRADDGNYTLTGGPEFGFGWTFLNFGPGLDSASAYVYLTDDNNQEQTETLVLKLSDFDANNCPDSAFTLFVKDDESPQPISIAFDRLNDTVFEDTAGVTTIAVTVNNPWNKTYLFQITTAFDGTAKQNDYSFFFNHDPLFSAPPGISHDTVFIRVKNDAFVEDTEQAYVRFKYSSINTATDTVYTLSILDRDTVQIGFLGAAYSFLENEGKCTVKLVTTSPMKVPISVPVTYYNGNATQNTDFTFVDTVITFPAFSMDTQEVYVTLNDDNIDEINEQINLRIGDLSPVDIGHQGIRQFTFFIIDNDSTTLGIEEDAIMVSAYPNPVSNYLNLSTDFPMNSIQVMSIDGKTIFSSFLVNEQKVTLNTSDWNSGLFILRITSADKVKTVRIIKN
jgi:hypothetical protein